MSTDGGSAIEVAATGAAAVRLSLRGTTESSDPSDAPFLVEAAEARRAIRTWTRYEPTPVVALPELARRLGVRAVSCKDESGRFGLGSFKALGGAYAVLRVLQDTIERHTGERPTDEELRRGHPLAADVTTTTASAGNHGRSVAWGSEQLGCGCVVVLPADAVPARAAAIESHGARVERFDGGYDGAVAHVQERATEEGWVVVSDTAYPGYEKTPQRIMEGYTLIADELVETLER
ncbi:MAG: pyridoxal-phosphate dependent enzyme, partial [Gemmatimonadetes bacterium]|nr:pyridoxal-phosphate dependent enzyme [Gemmatimonadota bacterium]